MEVDDREEEEFSGLFATEGEERYKILEKFYIPKNINFKTDLADLEIGAISIVEWADDILKN